MSNPQTPDSVSTNAGLTTNASTEAEQGAAGAVDLNLQEMREDLSQLAGVVARVADRRMTRARVKTEAMMRDYPWTTVSVAAVAGCLFALAVTPRSRHSPSSPSRLPDFNFADVGRYIPAPALPQNSVKPITLHLEQVADWISRLDPKTATPALEKIREWFGSTISRIRN